MRPPRWSRGVIEAAASDDGWRSEEERDDATRAAVDAGRIVAIAGGSWGEGPGTGGSPGAALKAIAVGKAAEWSARAGPPTTPTVCTWLRS